MIPYSTTTALKEWPSAIDALSSGRQVLLLRKGGIAEREFVLDTHRFLLMPSWFHEGGSAPEELSISHWCQVLEVWTTTSMETILKLEPLVVLSRKDLETRHHFRPGQSLHIIGVQTFSLPSIISVPMRPEYQGCRSWVTLEEPIAEEGSRAVLSEEAVRSRLAEVAALIAPAH